MARQTKNSRQREIDEHIGRMIRYHRKVKGWTRVELSKRVDVTKHSLGIYETGKASVSLSRLIELAEAFGISPYDFIEPVIEREDALYSAQHRILMDKVKNVPEDKIRLIGEIIDAVGDTTLNTQQKKEKYHE